MSGDRRGEKLVRDRIPELVQHEGGRADTRIADEREYSVQLLEKLREEVDELIAGGRTEEEIADILEVLESIARDRGIKWQRILQYQRGKRILKGGFDGRVVMVIDSEQPKS